MVHAIDSKKKLVFKGEIKPARQVLRQLIKQLGRQTNLVVFGTGISFSGISEARVSAMSAFIFCGLLGKAAAVCARHSAHTAADWYLLLPLLPCRPPEVITGEQHRPWSSVIAAHSLLGVHYYCS